MSNKPVNPKTLDAKGYYQIFKNSLAIANEDENRFFPEDGPHPSYRTYSTFIFDLSTSETLQFTIETLDGKNTPIQILYTHASRTIDVTYDTFAQNLWDEYFDETFREQIKEQMPTSYREEISIKEAVRHTDIQHITGIFGLPNEIVGADIYKLIIEQEAEKIPPLETRPRISKIQAWLQECRSDPSNAKPLTFYCHIGANQEVITRYIKYEIEVLT